MYLEKKIKIEFTEKEKEAINNFMALYKECRESKINSLCDYIDCNCCPFDSLCTNNISNANEMEDHINKNLE